MARAGKVITGKGNMTQNVLEAPCRPRCENQGARVGGAGLGCTMSSLSLPASPRPSANQKPRPRADVLAQKHTDHVSHFRGNLGVKQASLRSAMKSSRTAQEGLSELDKLLASFGDDDSHKNEEGDNLQTRETDDSPVELRRSSGNRDTVVITFQSCPEHPGFLSFYQV